MRTNPNPPNRPRRDRTPYPRHRASRGREVVRYQREPWVPPGWLLLALCAAGLLLALITTIVR